MSPGRVVDYPLGLRSQGPEFKSPSGRFCETQHDERSEESASRETPTGGLSSEQICGLRVSSNLRQDARVTVSVLACSRSRPLAWNSVRTLHCTGATRQASRAAGVFVNRLADGGSAGRHARSRRSRFRFRLTTRRRRCGGCPPRLTRSACCGRVERIALNASGISDTVGSSNFRIAVRSDGEPRLNA